MTPTPYSPGLPLLPLALAMAYAFSNGFRDASTIVATVVSTRTLTPLSAFVLCAACEFLGAMLIGSAVARTVAHRLFGGLSTANRSDVLLVLAAALTAALLWGGISWWRAWPTSNNQALFGGVAGAGLSLWGTQPFAAGAFPILLTILILSPIVGFLLSIVLTAALRWIGARVSIRAKPIAEACHIAACAAVSSAHGSNDGQIVMGLATAALGVLPLSGVAGTSGVPMWVRIGVASAIALGVSMGGRRLLKRMSMTFYRIRDPQGLGAELTSAATILTCAISGFPASTTQVITGSIVGAGVAQNPRAIRWHIAPEIVFSWGVTLPAAAIGGFLICRILVVLVHPI